VLSQDQVAAVLDTSEAGGGVHQDRALAVRDAAIMELL
jgi:hypothetical protein